MTESVNTKHRVSNKVCDFIDSLCQIECTELEVGNFGLE